MRVKKNPPVMKKVALMMKKTKAKHEKPNNKSVVKKAQPMMKKVAAKHEKPSFSEPTGFKHFSPRLKKLYRKLLG